MKPDTTDSLRQSCKPDANQSSIYRFRTACGFTLVEILIVTVCIAIAALLVLPAAGGTSSAKLKGAGKMLAADLQFAQLQAMGNSSRRCVLVFDTDAQNYHLSYATSPTVPITNPGDSQPYVTVFGGQRANWLAGVSIDSLSVGGDDTLGFTAFGALDQGSDAVITLRCGDETLTLTLDALTGDVQVN